MPNPVLGKVCSLFIQLTLFIYQNPPGWQQRELQRKAVFYFENQNLILILIGMEPGALLTGWFFIAFVTNEHPVFPSGVADGEPGVADGGPGVAQASLASAGTG